MQCTRYMSYAVGGSFIGLSLLRTLAFAVVGQPFWKGERGVSHVLKLSEWTGWNRLHTWLAACYIRGYHQVERGPYDLLGRVQDWTRDVFALSQENKFFNAATLFGLMWLGGTTLYSFRSSLPRFLSEQRKLIQHPEKPKFLRACSPNETNLGGLHRPSMIQMVPLELKNNKKFPLDDQPPLKHVQQRRFDRPFSPESLSHSDPLIRGNFPEKRWEVAKKINYVDKKWLKLRNSVSNNSNMSTPSSFSDFSDMSKFVHVKTPNYQFSFGGDSPSEPIPDLPRGDTPSLTGGNNKLPSASKLKITSFSTGSLVVIDPHNPES